MALRLNQKVVGNVCHFTRWYTQFSTNDCIFLFHVWPLNVQMSKYYSTKDLIDLQGVCGEGGGAYLSPDTDCGELEQS